MALQLYRRHTSGCLAQRKRWDRAYRRCRCPIHAEGTLRVDGFIRKATGETVWEAADQVKRTWEQAGTTSFAPEAERHVAEPDVDGPITIAKAVAEYLADAKSRNLAESTRAKLATIFNKQFLTWCDSKGYRYLVDLAPAAVREFRNTWKDQPLAKSKKQARIVSFFYFCVRSGWLATNPITTRELGKIIVKHHPTGYFTPAEYAKLIDATYLYRDRRWERGDNMQLGGARIRTLTELMRWTGLRIRDAVTLEGARLSIDPLDLTDRIMLYQAKTGEPVFCPIPPRVAEMLRHVPPGPKPNDTYFFWSGNGDPKTAVADWQRSYRKLFTLAGIRNPDGTPKRCFPHMLRDTFAVESLVAGMKVEHVSVLLGHHSVQITEKHYLPWVRARQISLTEDVKRVWITQGEVQAANDRKVSSNSAG